MADLAKHWDDVFTGKPDAQLGWYEPDVRQTLRLLDLVPRNGSATVFLPGAGTSILVDELLARGLHLTVNDISDEALARLRGRVRGREGQVAWLPLDISKPVPESTTKADVWIDRAVLHFFLSEPEIDGYFRNLRAVLRPGGHVLLAEFSDSGAPRCAGLEVHRYSVDEMARRLGQEFSLVKAEDFVFMNPAGAPRPYVYALFRRQ